MSTVESNDRKTQARSAGVATVATDETFEQPKYSREVTLLTMLSVLLVMLLASLDQTIVGTAMPRIIADLNGFEQYTWVTTAYLLTSTVMVPIYGKLSDLYGRKGILIFAVIVFLAGSFLSGASQSMTATYPVPWIPGDRRWRSDVDGYRDYRRPLHTTRAREMAGCHWRGLRPGLHRRPNGGRLDYGSPVLALGLLRQHANRYYRAGRTDLPDAVADAPDAESRRSTSSARRC